MKTLTPFLLLLTLLSCKNSKDFKSDFEKHKFDPTVINNLPLYDTLRQIILNNYDSFNLSNTNISFTYIYNFDTSTQISGHSNSDIPEIIYPNTVQLFKGIGKENIFGFTISKDSTFEILVRNTHLTKYFLDVRERLYWYPAPGKIVKTEFPTKDTLITDKWQYQIYYDKRAEF
ncbi:hypothetical protein [Ferruginibacter sp.]|nr:hypothetical protein [Ferruginibacter sp.]